MPNFEVNDTLTEIELTDTLTNIEGLLREAARKNCSPRGAGIVRTVKESPDRED